MTTRTPTIAAFITAQLDADEAAARAAMGNAWILEGGRRAGKTAAREFWNRHDPARVLATVAALRAVVEACERFARHPEWAHDMEMSDAWEVADDTLRALASIWKDAPGFDAGWAE